MSLSSDLQDLVAQPMIAVQNGYVSARREMNIHDFHFPDQGGERLISVMDSAKQELGHFINDRGLRLAEPMEVRITIEVVATTEPKPEPDASEPVRA